MPERLKRLEVLVPLVLLLGLACGPCNWLSQGLPTPPPRIGVTPEAAAQLKARVAQTLVSPPGQQFILRLTDTEMTSFLALELAKYDESPVADPMVWFTKGQIYATGRLVNVVPFSTNFHLVAAPRIEEGKVVVDIKEISAGVVPIPRRALDLISQSINETVDEAQLELEVTAIEVLEGEMILQGARR